ncbi:MAG: hypothetical protein MUF57_04940 [Gammaproteobacteria bacterium]|nr:hypothetical protein [Gammaproteobacteria bacterium]
MLLNPAILALLGVSAIVTLLVGAATAFGLHLLRQWDIASGSELQLRLERRTYLIATLVAFSFVAELVSLLLFVYNAEAMHTQFVGAMCATGVLNVNPWGWPTLFLKIAVFFTGAVWLALNHLDNQGHDYPLVRVKYGLLLALFPLVLAAGAAQALYFLGLRPDVITSCCGALFSPESAGVAAEVAGLAPARAALALAASGALVLGAGSWVLLRGSGGGPFAAAGLLAFVVAIAAVVSLVALYVYEHPHHHCPFCVLKPGHDHVGYWLYVPLFAATALALGAGAVAPWRRVPSLAHAVPGEVRRRTRLAVIGYALFYAVATYAILRSNLTMTDVWW